MNKKQLALLLCVLVLLCAVLTSCGKNKTVNLTMEANNGTSATVEAIKKNESYTLPVLTREGYSFEGWFTAQDFSGAPVTSVTPNADVTVYAKWEQLYTLTLDAKGGTLSTASFLLKAGASIDDAIAGAVPTKENSRFRSWLLDGELLPAGALMRAENITLTADYQVAYTVEIYLQNATLDGYVKSDKTVTDYADVGATVTSKQTVTGFNEVKKSESVTTLVISEDASKNVYKHYFDRASYSLTYVSNFPDGSQNQTVSKELTYGIKTDVPFVTFEMDGYYLEGWSLTPGGDVLYYSHVMDGKLFNADAHEQEQITPDAPLTLYAVWSKGYTDLFGGQDIIYVANSEEETVYLYRGETYFQGYLDKGTDLIFEDSKGDILYEGKLNSDGQTFLYLKKSRGETIATLYEMGNDKGLDENVKLYFDDANGITYSVKGEDGTTTDSKGEYFFNADGQMVATFTSGNGEMVGKTITLIVGTITLNNTTTTAFQVRNDEEYKLGTILFYTVKDNAITVATDADDNTVGELELNGFGIASYNNGKNKVSYYYTYDAEKKTVSLRTAQGVAGVARLVEINGVLGYMIYDESKDVTYTLDDGSTLSLNGMQSATYTKGETSVTGFYSEKSSAFGGVILSFTADRVTYRFMITSKTEEVLVDPTDLESEKTTKTVTTVEQKNAGYSEYYFKYADAYYYAPLFVFDSADKATVTVWGYTSAKTYQKMAVGTMVYDAVTKTYVFTPTEKFEAPDAFKTPVDFSTVKSVVLMLDDTATDYSINFWLSYTNEVETIDNTTVYTGENGATLTLVAGMVISNIDGRIEIGTFTGTDGQITVTFPERTATVKLDDEGNTFTYVTAPTTIYEVKKDGTIMSDHYILFTTKDDVTYNIITLDEEENQHLTKYTGKIYATDKTSLTGFKIYQFISDDKKGETEEPLISMQFIQISSNKNYFFPYDEAYAGTFTSENGVLKLDGFGYAATYGDENGTNVIGMYQKNGNDVLITATEGSFYFLLNETSFALRGEEYGKAFVVMDNQVFRGVYVSLDGLGHASVFKFEVKDSETVRVDIDTEATYTIDGSNVILSYKDGTEEYVLDCAMGIYVVNASQALNSLSIKHEEVVTSYVNVEDWSVLKLNSDGTAVKYMTDGGVETGTFSLVTDSLLYYVNSAATDAYIYVYDRETGIATPQNYDVVAYYTKDLQSLLFSKYGFAIFNNETRYYYTVNEGKVTIYHLDAENPEASAYGYVAEDFGTFTDTKNYNDKVYYKNDGFAITFSREADSADKYPVLVSAKEELYASPKALVFTPTGGSTFSVAGKVTINDTAYDCTVVRKLNEDETTYSMYIRVGYFYFGVEIDYRGDSAESTYVVTSLEYSNVMPSYNYLYYYYYIYSMMGSNYASQFKNTYGTLELHTDYDEEGKETANYMNAVFGEGSGFLDADGNLIEELDHADLRYLGSNYYIATFEGKDGYNYSLIINYTTFSAFKTYAYRVYGLMREETVTANDGYEVTVKRMIASDAGYPAGSYFSFALSKDGTKLDSSSVMLNDGKLYYIVRDVNEEGKILSTTYYELELTEKASESMESEEKDEKKPLPVYESAKVTPTEATTYMSADGKDFIDILPDHKVLLMNVEGKSILITNTEYDEATATYTLETSDEKTYTVTITEGVATFIEVTPAE